MPYLKVTGAEEASIYGEGTITGYIKNTSIKTEGLYVMKKISNVNKI